MPVRIETLSGCKLKLIIMEFDPFFNLNYAPDDEEPEVDEYPEEDEDMERYYESKYE